MKHVYPPRHPAWLDDKPGRTPPAGAETPEAPQAPPTRAQDEAGRGGTTDSGPPADGARKHGVDGDADAARRP